MDIIVNQFLNKVGKYEAEQLKDLDKYKEIIREKDLKIENLNKKYETLQEKFDKLEKKNIDLQDELTNLNKVSLLKNLHVKYDKIKHRNKVLNQRVAFYKNKLLKNDIKMEDTIDLTSSQFDVISNKESEKSQTVDLTETKAEIRVKIEKTEDESELSEDEEVNVELKKIKKRFYYIDSDGDEAVVYKAIKIKKGEYDVGDRIGILISGNILKD